MISRPRASRPTPPTGGVAPTAPLPPTEAESLPAQRRRAALAAQKQYMDQRFGRDRPMSRQRSA